MKKSFSAAAALGFALCTFHAAADEASPPIKIAVFPFKLEDFSAAASQGNTQLMAEALRESTEEAKRQLLQSGRYQPIDTGPSDETDKAMRECDGCEREIAQRLGADELLVGVINKISMTEYVVKIEISNTQDRAIVSASSTDLRIGAYYAWSRGVRWLMQNRVLAAHQ